MWYNIFADEKSANIHKKVERDMKINIIGRRMEVEENLKLIIQKKLAKFDKYFKDDAVAYVTLSHEKNAERLELTRLKRRDSLPQRGDGRDLQQCSRYGG